MKRPNLNRGNGQLNAWLLAIAIGLGVLDLTVLVTKSLPPLPQTPVAAGSANGAPAAPPPPAAAASGPHG